MNTQARESTKIMLPTKVSLLLTVKNTIIEYQAKLFPFAKAFLGICLSGLILVSCASGQKRAGNIWWADYTQNSRGDCTIDGQKMGEYWFNDTKSKTYGYQIPQGQHNVEISTRWSNGFEDSAQLTFDVKEGRKYTIYTHELQEGQDPNASLVLPREYQEHGGGTSLAPLAKNVGEGALQIVGATAFVIISPYVLIYGSPIWVPYLVYAYYQQNKKSKDDKGPQNAMANTEAQPTDSVVEAVTQPADYTEAQVPDPNPVTETKPEDTEVAAVGQPIEPPPAPTARPFDGCCYVWIEDFEAKEVVAGTRLPGVAR
jgi:hypothetical protein